MPDYWFKDRLLKQIIPAVISNPEPNFEDFNCEQEKFVLTTDDKMDQALLEKDESEYGCFDQTEDMTQIFISEKIDEDKLDIMDALEEICKPLNIVK